MDLYIWHFTPRQIEEGTISYAPKFKDLKMALQVDVDNELSENRAGHNKIVNWMQRTRHALWNRVLTLKNHRILLSFLPTEDFGYAYFHGKQSNPIKERVKKKKKAFA